MVKFKLFTTSIVVMALVILATGCKKTTTEETFEPGVLLNKLSVSVVPQGTEDITVTATDEYNSPLTFSVECEDEDIATVTKNDSTITITGKNFGTTNVKIRCDTDTSLNKTIPVQIYDPKVLEAGELMIAFIDTFEYRWNSDGISQGGMGSFYHPIITDSFYGFYALGSIGLPGLSDPNDPNGKKSIVAVKAKPGSDALKPPVYYDFVWNSQGSGAYDEGSFWNPIPPAGYKALGTVAQQGYDEPSINDVVCVREDLVIEGVLDTINFFWGVSTGPKRFKSCLIYPPNAGPHDSCYLKTGMFAGTEYEPQPPSYPVLYVLKVMLPNLTEGADQTFAPKLTGYDEPPERTVPLMTKEIVVPWSIVKDGQYDTVWRFVNSPNYRVEREVYYQLEFHNYNQTSELQTNSWSKTVGVSEERSESWWNETGMALSVEVGVSFQGVAWGGHLNITGSISKQMGYERTTGITEFEEKTITVSVNTPPGKAAALWRKFSRFTVKRHNRKRLETVGIFDIGTESYITDEYPHEK